MSVWTFDVDWDDDSEPWDIEENDVADEADEVELWEEDDDLEVIDE